MTSWRQHPKLQGRFHPEFPDDLQVIAHDGHPRISGHGAELVWVRVSAAEGDVFRGKILNTPVRLTSVAEGTEILFIIPDAGEHPLHVSAQYLAQRGSWRLLMPCQKCGLTELLSPARDLFRSTFPSLGDDPLEKGFTLTTKCGWCGGGQVVRIKRVPLA